VLSVRAGCDFVVPFGTIAIKSSSWPARVAGRDANEAEGLLFSGRSERH
jgi:hypothetical protein